jgi:hypothetical protein
MVAIAAIFCLQTPIIYRSKGIPANALEFRNFALR